MAANDKVEKVAVEKVEKTAPQTAKKAISPRFTSPCKARAVLASLLSLLFWLSILARLVLMLNAWIPTPLIKRLSTMLP